MKSPLPFALICCMLLTYLFPTSLYAQPYNSFENAKPIAASQQVTEQVCSSQDVYLTTLLPANGKMVVQMSITNNSSSNGYVYAYAYDARKNSGLLYAGYIAASSIAPGQTSTASFSLPGLLADSVFIRLTSSACFSVSTTYTMQQTPVNDTEPNNSIAQAVPISFTSVTAGNIAYKKSGVEDVDDFYYTILPDNGTLHITATGQNVSANSGYLYLYAYDRPQLNSLIFADYVQTSTIDAGATANETFVLKGRAKDTVYIRMIASRAFNYNLSFSMSENPTADAEPNDNFQQANSISATVPAAGIIGYYSNGSSDENDYFKTKLPEDAAVRIYVSATNRDSKRGYIYMYGYDMRKSSGQQFGRYISNATSINAGATILDTITVTGQLADSFYIRLISSAAFSYSFRYEMIQEPTSEDPEPNNTFDEAFALVSGQAQVGRIGYTSGSVTDEKDYYQTQLPGFGTFRVVVQGTNKSASSGYMYVRLYDGRKASGQLLADYVGTSNVMPDVTVSDTFYVYGRQAGLHYLLMESTRSFNYTIQYDLIDAAPEDEEQNADTSSAIHLPEQSTLTGNIGYRVNGTDDASDYYRLQLAQNGTLHIKLKGINTQNTNGYIYVYVYDARGNGGQIAADYIQSSSVAANVNIADSFVLKGRSAGTYFIRVTSSGSFTYDLSYTLENIIPQDVESNNTIDLAQNVLYGATVSGNIGYVQRGLTDNDDFFAGQIPAYGTARVIIKATNTGSTNGYVYHYGYNGRKLSGQLFARYVKGSSHLPGATIADTFLIPCRAVDSFYHRITSSGAWQYEWTFDLVNTSLPEADTNNTFTTATQLPIDSVVEDNIGYLTKNIEDGDDYFVTAMPARGTIQYVIKGTNTQNSNGYLYVYIYRKGTSSNPQLTAAYVKSSSVSAGTSIIDTIGVNCVTADSVFIRVISSGCFKYSIKPLYVNRNPEASFTHLLGGGLYEFINQSQRADSYAWQLGDGTTSTQVAPNLKAYAAGSYPIRLIAKNSTCNYVDTANMTLVVRGLDRYSPNNSGPGNIEFSAYGGGFTPNTRITLSGQGKIFRDSIRIVATEGNKLSAVIDLHDAPTGQYDVSITTDDTSYTIPNGYRVDGLIDQLKTEIIGRDVIRVNTATTYKVRVHNEGNTMAGGVELYVLFPAGMEVTLLNKLVDIVTLNVPNDTLANLPAFRKVTKAQGYPTDGNLYALYLAGIPQQGYRDINFNVKSAILRDRIYTWVVGPLSGSEERSWVSDCNKARLKLAGDLVFDGASLVPGLDCAANVVRAGISSLYAGVSYFFTGSTGDATNASVGKSVAGALKNCAGEITVNPVVEAADITTDILLLESNLALNAIEIENKCPEEQPKPNEKPVQVRNSLDPNSKVGPAGYGTAGYINNQDRIMNYTIYFENVDSATLPAQTVEIIDTLDKNVFDVHSFRALSYTIGDTSIFLPMNASDYVSDIPYDSLYNIRFSIQIDTTTGALKALLKTIDKQTGTLPEDPLAGFLPPNVNSPEGEGNISFAINLKAGLADGTSIQNKASIIFDTNEPIITNTWLNTIDVNRPATQAVSANRIQDTTAVIRVNGADASSGVRHYLVYVSDNGGPYQYLGKIGKDSALFTGAAEHVYRFYTLGVDSVGNTEMKGPSAETTVSFAGSLPVVLQSFTGTATNVGNKLHWITKTEYNNKGFYVERSQNASNFTTMQFVTGIGNSNLGHTYQITDNNPWNLTYYRLKQVDTDGRFTYSSIVRVNRTDNQTYTISPNPVSKSFTISNAQKITGLRLVDVHGKTVQVFTPNASGQYQIKTLPAGVYLLQIVSPQGSITKKIQILQ